MKNIITAASFFLLTGVLAYGQNSLEGDNEFIAPQEQNMDVAPQEQPGDATAPQPEAATEAQPGEATGVEPVTTMDIQPEATETQTAAATTRTVPAKFKALPEKTRTTLHQEFPGCTILSTEIFDSADGGGPGSASYGIKLIWGDDRYNVEISPEGKMISRLKQYN